MHPSRHDPHRAHTEPARCPRHPLGVSPEDAERQDFAPDSPRGNAICRMVDASEIAFVAVFLASDKAWAVSGELVAATGGPGGRYFTKQRFECVSIDFFNMESDPAFGVICQPPLSLNSYRSVSTSLFLDQFETPITEIVALGQSPIKSGSPRIDVTALPTLGDVA